MPLRFSKRISLGKFLRLNISKSGVGVTVGPRGANITLGPRGTHATVGLPGSGLSYTQKIGDAPIGNFPQSSKSQIPKSQPSIREPGAFAPEYEKELVAGLNAFNSGKADSALPHFLAAGEEPAAAIYAAFILAGQPDGKPQALSLLENVVASDSKLPTVLMQKYLSPATLPIAISPTISADAPVNSSAAPLLLAELYQAEGRAGEAIALLDEIVGLSPDPAITLSVCELLAEQVAWDEIIERAQNTTATDDVTFETRIWYGRAMLEKGLAEAAIRVLTESLRKKSGLSAALLHEARYWRAVAYERAGKKSQANKEFQKLYADAPDFKDVAGRVST